MFRIKIQYSLFDYPLKAEKIRELYEAVDALSGKYRRREKHCKDGDGVLLPVIYHPVISNGIFSYK